jgi:hypothetical protein
MESQLGWAIYSLENIVCVALPRLDVFLERDLYREFNHSQMLGFIPSHLRLCVT